MSPAPVELGLVGCGRLAELGYLPALALVPQVRLVAVADPDPDRRAAVAAAGEGVATFPDAAALLAGATVDGLVVATPAAAHVDVAEAAASAGVLALVEKPPAPDAAGAARLATLAPAPVVGFNRRFDPGAAAVRAAVPGRGDVDLRATIAYRRRGWAAHTVADDALADLGPHLVDWARWITGSEVVAVACPELRPQRAMLELTLGRGRARLRAATDRPHRELVELGVGGRLVARHRLGGPVAAVRGVVGRTGPTALVATLARQLEAFAAACRGGAPPRAPLGTAGDGHAAMLVLGAARASAAAGGRPTPVTGAC
ncbi:MAG TPA: Gfo/Idh/MocA family oxidoreductase [Acidimicrobiales bacterium]|nr:Gfo/Idh/MocA family oxidoreductase [Acidimicrobiales bacterium]